MWNAMVDDTSRSDAAFPFAVPAERKLSEVAKSGLLPPVVVTPLARGQSLAPRIGVQHLDRLRISYGCASWLHTDAGLSHISDP